MNFDTNQSVVNSLFGRTQRSTFVAREHYDLLGLLVLALLLPGTMLLSLPLLRVPLGLLMVLLAPGYALAAALFPSRGDLDGVARLALSFGLSVAILPVLTLLVNLLPWGIRPWPIVASLSTWIALCCIIALGRRLSLQSSGAPYLPPAIEQPRWRVRGGWPLVRFVVGALLLSGGLAFAAWSIVAAQSTQYLTEFYLLGTAGLAEDYPRSARVGEDVSVTIGINNYERDTHAYRIELWAINTGSTDQRVRVAEQAQVSLAASQSWQGELAWQMPWAGEDQQLELLLFMDASPEPYRKLTLWLNVAE